MKPDIHPDYHEIEVQCSCGNTFVTRATAANKKIHLEICSKCHPFYTGKQKIVDTAGRVERFRQKFSKDRKVATQKVAVQEVSKSVGKKEAKKAVAKE